MFYRTAGTASHIGCTSHVGSPGNGGLVVVLITLGRRRHRARFSLRLICANCARDCHSGLNKQGSRAARIRWLALNCVTTIISYSPVELQSDFIFEQICVHKFCLFGFSCENISIYLYPFDVSFPTTIKLNGREVIAYYVSILCLWDNGILYWFVYLLCSKQIVRGAEWRGGRRGPAARERQRRRQVGWQLRLAAPAVRLPAPGCSAAQLSAVRPPRHPRQNEQPSFLMGVAASPWVTVRGATSPRGARRCPARTPAPHNAPTPPAFH